jgi:hypothetical protein
LLRIPYTLNSKCLDSGRKDDTELKLIQRFDPKNIPQIDRSLLREFRLYLADLDIKNKVEATTREKDRIQKTKTYPYKTQNNILLIYSKRNLI